MAINTVIRSCVGAVFPLVTPAMYDNLGIQWAGTLLGCLALLGLPIPFVLVKFGPRIVSLEAHGRGQSSSSSGLSQRAMSKNVPKAPPRPQPPVQLEDGKVVEVEEVGGGDTPTTTVKPRIGP